MRPLALSIGPDYNLAQVELHQFDSFASFAEFIEAQQPQGGQVGPYLCAPMSNGHRCEEAAQPTRVLALDFDELPPEAPRRLCEAIEAAGWRAVLWTTRSHTPEAPRLRIVFELDRAVDKPEYARVYRGIVRHLAESTELALAADESCAKPEQPAVLPQPRSTLWRWSDGARLSVDAFVEYDPGANGAEKRPRPTEPDVADDPILAALQARGLYLRRLEAGKHAVYCPWASEHTKPSSDSSTAVMLPNYGGYRGHAFKCMHAHCSGRTIRDLREFLGLESSVDEVPAAKVIPRPSVIVNDADFPATEDGMALAFAAAHVGQLVFDHQAGSWYRWTGDRWQREETQLAFAWARDLVRQFNERADQRTLTRVSVAKAVELAARADRKLAVAREAWDRDDNLLCVPGGIVDLSTGTLTAPDPGKMMSRQTSVAPAPRGAPCPLWTDFLRETTAEDAELIGFLQRMAGLCLTGDVSLELLFFIFGPGGNGKGVFIRTLASIMGDYAAAAAIATFTAQRQSVHLTELARLQGARLVTASETERGHRWAESRIKELTGNERPIVANFMRQDHFEFWPKFKLVIVGNYRPALVSVTPAIARRLRIIPFTHTPERPDPELKARLETEYPAILRWMLDGLADLRTRGLTDPVVVTEATAAYLADEDRIGRWIEDCCTRVRGFKCTPSTLFRSFSEWCKNQGDEPGTQKAFTDDIDRLGLRRGRTGKARFIEGLMVGADDAPDRHRDSDG